jgi:uncharacterized Ntn-hydrolase superfamily protein
MTWSIVARDKETGHFGVAVASRFFAVGCAVPHLKGRVGAVATQAFVSPLYGTDGLKMLEDGIAPETIIADLTARDDGRHQRQMHLIDAAGRNTAYTGSACIDWAGHLIDDNVSVAGNMLVGPDVIAQTLRVYKERTAAGAPLAERLLDAMDAGEAAGGTSAAANRPPSSSTAIRIIPGCVCMWTIMPNRSSSFAASIRWLASASCMWPRPCPPATTRMA